MFISSGYIVLKQRSSDILKYVSPFGDFSFILQSNELNEFMFCQFLGFRNMMDLCSGSPTMLQILWDVMDMAVRNVKLLSKCKLNPMGNLRNNVGLLYVIQTVGNGAHCVSYFRSSNNMRIGMFNHKRNCS